MPKAKKRRYTYTGYSDETTRNDISSKLIEGSPFWCFLNEVVGEIYSGGDHDERLRHDGMRELADKLLRMTPKAEENKVRKNLE